MCVGGKAQAALRRWSLLAMLGLACAVPAAYAGDLPMGKLSPPGPAGKVDQPPAASNSPANSAQPIPTSQPSSGRPFPSRLWSLLAAEPDQIQLTAANVTRGGVARSKSIQQMPTFRPQGYIKTSGGYFRLVRQPGEPLAPLQPVQPIVPSTAPITPVQPLQPVPALGALPTFGEGGIMSALQSLPADRAPMAASIAPVASATSAPALAVNARPDLAQAIADQDLAVQTMWRGSISEMPVIRGYKYRQIYAQLDGQYFEPVRWDLDTVLNKIDPGIVQDVIVVQGPYSVQYGPGFTFMDVVTRPTPRNQPTQYRSSMSWIPNGQQIYARETVSGGSQDFGYRFSYGHRNANDYQSGNGTHIPSHYNTGDVLAELGYNLSAGQRIEAVYRRQDTNHTAYPGQFFDISSMETNAYNLRYIDEDVTMPWTRFVAQGWYNNNNLTGNTFNSTKQPIVNAVERSLTESLYPSIAAPFGSPPATPASNPALPPLVGFSGSTVGSLTSTGGRATAQFGELDEVSLLTGADVRFVNQRVTEYFTVNPFAYGTIPPAGMPAGPPLPPTPATPPTPFSAVWPFNFSTGMPRATMINPGIFAEATLPWTSYFRTKIGARGDYVDTNAYSNTFPLNGTANPSFFPPTSALPAGPLNKANGLYAFYMVNQLDITQHWNAAFSFGQAQRPPSLIDRYADGMFLGILQSGYRRVIGNPNLAPERNWQIDAQINGNYENWRGFVRGYNSWVNNYITYSANAVLDPTGAVLMNTLNTPQAQLRGFEAFNSFDVAPRVTPFASARYVYGEDVTIHQALWQIPPLQAFAGIRFHDPNKGARWGLEVFATMTQAQNRTGVIRVNGVDPTAPGGLYNIENRVGGWTIASMRGYWNISRNLMFSGGINNIFNRNYIQYLSLQTTPLQVLSPGISPYMSLEWIY